MIPPHGDWLLCASQADSLSFFPTRLCDEKMISAQESYE
jgi:hypothetical protein